MGSFPKDDRVSYLPLIVEPTPFLSPERKPTKTPIPRSLVRGAGVVGVGTSLRRTVVDSEWTETE